MSSRSNGVMKVEFARLMIAWVVSSAWCSASRICSPRAFLSVLTSSI